MICQLFPPTQQVCAQDMYLDRKKFELPLTVGHRGDLGRRRVRGAHRRRSEGLDLNMTKPHGQRNRKAPAGVAKVLAGVTGDKIVVWHYHTEWNGAVASDAYRKVVKPALMRHRPGKRKHILVEDNDPTGFRCRAAECMKAACVPHLSAIAESMILCCFAHTLAILPMMMHSV